MTPEIKAFREKFVAARDELKPLIEESAQSTSPEEMAGIAFVVGAFAVKAVSDLLDALCKEP